MSRTRTVHAVIGAAALVLTSCGSGSSGPQLVYPPNLQDVTMGLQEVKPNVEVSFGGMIVCLNKSGSVTLTGVKTIGGTGQMQIREWGVRPSPWWKKQTHQTGTGIGVLLGSLKDNGFTPGSRVTVTCDKATGRGYELAVAASIPDSVGDTVKGLRVDYVSDGKHESLTYPIGLPICPHKFSTTDSDACA